jgi:hypothetical protein
VAEGKDSPVRLAESLKRCQILEKSMRFWLSPLFK